MDAGLYGSLAVGGCWWLFLKNVVAFPILNPMQLNPKIIGWLLLVVRSIVLVFVLSPAWAETAMNVEIQLADQNVSEQVRGLLSDEQLDNVNNALSLLNAVENGASDPVYLTRLYAKAPDEIRQALRPFGYYTPDIDASLDLESQPPKATFVITRGRPVKVTEVEIQLFGDGQNDSKLRQLITDFPLTPGQRLRHPDYELGKQRLINRLKSRGYFDYEIKTKKILVNPQTYSAEIYLEFDTGPRYRFGHVMIEGNHLNPRVAEKFVRFEEADYYSEEKLFATQNELSTSPWFAYADVEVRREQRDDATVPVSVNVVPNKKNAYKTGVGYGTDTGARVSIGYERRWLNDDGVSLASEFDYAERRKHSVLRFSRPAFSSRLDHYAMSMSYLDEDTDTSSTVSQELSFTQQGRWRGWHDTLGLVIRHDQFEIGSTRDRTLLVMPTAQITRTEADNLLFPREGYSLSVQLRGASEVLASDLDFLQLAVYGRYVMPAFAKDRMLFRLHAGTTWTNEFEKMPPELRFLTGGDRSVRGFGYQRLGPRDSNNDVVGGQNLLVASVEYEYRFDQQWAAAGFVDFGSAFNDVEAAVGDTDLFEGSVGAGARWLSPVGMIRLDLAVVVTEDDYPMRLHFTLGPDL